MRYDTVKKGRFMEISCKIGDDELKSCFVVAFKYVCKMSEPF